MKKIKDISRVVDEVNSNGFSIIPNFWDQKKCSHGRSEIDSIISKYPVAISKILLIIEFLLLNIFLRSLEMNLLIIIILMTL